MVKVMWTYMRYPLDDAGRITGPPSFHDHMDDHSALAAAQVAFASVIDCACFEIWQEDRLIGQVGRQAMIR